MQSQMPLVVAREFKAPIEPAALGQPARSEGMRLCPRSSPSREGSSFSGSRAVRWQHQTCGALPKRVLPLNCAAHADARVSAVVCKGPSERSEEHTSELQSPCNLVCRLLLEKKK